MKNIYGHDMIREDLNFPIKIYRKRPQKSAVTTSPTIKAAPVTAINNFHVGSLSQIDYNQH